MPAFALKDVLISIANANNVLKDLHQQLMASPASATLMIKFTMRKITFARADVLQIKLGTMTRENAYVYLDSVGGTKSARSAQITQTPLVIKQHAHARETIPTSTLKAMDVSTVPMGMCSTRTKVDVSVLMALLLKIMPVLETAKKTNSTQLSVKHVSAKQDLKKIKPMSVAQNVKVVNIGQMVVCVLMDTPGTMVFVDNVPLEQLLILKRLHADAWIMTQFLLPISLNASLAMPTPRPTPTKAPVSAIPASPPPTASA